MISANRHHRWSSRPGTSTPSGPAGGWTAATPRTATTGSSVPAGRAFDSRARPRHGERAQCTSRARTSGAHLAPSLPDVGEARPARARPREPIENETRARDPGGVTICACRPPAPMEALPVTWVKEMLATYPADPGRVDREKAHQMHRGTYRLRPSVYRVCRCLPVGGHAGRAGQVHPHQHGLRRHLPCRGVGPVPPRRPRRRHHPRHPADVCHPCEACSGECGRYTRTEHCRPCSGARRSCETACNDPLRDGAICHGISVPWSSGVAVRRTRDIRTPPHETAGNTSPLCRAGGASQCQSRTRRKRTRPRGARCRCRPKSSCCRK